MNTKMNIIQQIDDVFLSFQGEKNQTNVSQLLGYSQSFLGRRKITGSKSLYISEKLYTALDVAGYKLDVVSKRTGEVYESKSLKAETPVEKIDSIMWDYWIETGSTMKAAKQLGLAQQTFVFHKDRKRRGFRLNDKLVNAIALMGYELVLINIKTGKRYDHNTTD